MQFIKNKKIYLNVIFQLCKTKGIQAILMYLQDCGKIRKMKGNVGLKLDDQRQKQKRRSKEYLKSQI